MSDYRVLAIEPSRLARVRDRGRDEQGNPLTPYGAEGWEPLRCCLRRAHQEEPIALISHAPFTTRSPWRETGPVFVHARACAGYEPGAGLPTALRTGPRILRTYRADQTLNYDHITLVEDGVDIDDPLRKLLAEPEVAIVHVRTVLPQCFLFAVAR